MRRLLALTLTAFTLTACGGGSDFADRDPNGARACAALSDAFENKDDADAAVSGSMDSGAAARKASTSAIRKATIDLGGDYAADPEAMVKACRAEGVDMPDVPS